MNGVIFLIALVLAVLFLSIFAAGQRRRSTPRYDIEEFLLNELRRLRDNGN